MQKIQRGLLNLFSPRQTILLIMCLLFSWQAVSAQTLALTEAQDSWQQIYSRGYAAFQANEYGNAERLLRESVGIAGNFGANDIRVAKSAGELGRLLTVRARFTEAEPYLEEELKVKEQVVGNTDGKLIATMGSLVQFYLNYGTAQKAEHLAYDVLFFVEGKIREEDEQRQTKTKLRKGVPLEGWTGLAAPAMQNPLIEWAITCDDLGNAFMSHGNFDLADRFFKAALDIKSTVLGKHHLSLANSYESLGSLCLARNELADAESYFRDALVITRKIQPPEHYQVYGRMDKLGRCLIKERKYGEAEDLYRQATQLWNVAPSNSGNEARALFALGCLYADEKRYAAAAPAIRRALQMSEAFNGPNSVSLVPYLRMYAYCLYYLGERAEVSQLRARANYLSPVASSMKANCSMKLGVWAKN